MAHAGDSAHNLETEISQPEEEAFADLERLFGDDPRFRLRRTHAADPYTLAACGIDPKDGVLL